MASATRQPRVIQGCTRRLALQCERAPRQPSSHPYYPAPAVSIPSVFPHRHGIVFDLVDLLELDLEDELGVGGDETATDVPDFISIVSPIATRVTYWLP